MRVHTVNTGLFKLDGGAMFGVVPKSIWNKVNPSDDNNLCTWAMRCLLIEEGNKLILVDNGIGNKQDAKFFGHYHLHGPDTLDGSLAALGFHRDDITDVFLTHLHFDHCGGSIVREDDRLVPAFKNATYWSNKRHWKWATEPNDREKASFLNENILPIQESGQLRFIEPEPAGQAISGDIQRAAPGPGQPATAGPGQPTASHLETVPNVIIPGLSIRLVNGHTDAMMLPQLTYKGKTLIFMADLLPSIGHIPLPYVMAYDMFPLTTLQEKRAFFDEAIAGDYVLFFEHDPVTECCTLERTEKGVRSSRTFRLDEL